MVVEFNNGRRAEEKKLYIFLPNIAPESIK